jgi:protein O-GlcNAc transferase
MRIPVASWVLVRFPRQRQEAFFSLLGESDVLLDSIHSFGGTTTFGSFVVGTPLVKWPGMFAQGRFTLACCQNKDVMDCVASSLEEYAELVLLLGNNREERDAVKQEIWLRIILF